MARRRTTQVAWNGAERDTMLNDAFAAMVARGQQELGRDDISIGTEGDADLVGLPLPALCLRYLFQSTTFPLSRITQLTGQEGSAKTAMLNEMARWHLVYGGGYVLAENENKDSPNLRWSIFRWQQNWITRTVKIPTYSMEQWQDVFTAYISEARRMQDDPRGPGRTVPFIIAVDSLTATAPQSEIDAILKDGHASRGYALLANLIARYMRTMPDRLKNYPFSVIGTNHLKPGQDARGIPTEHIPGGMSVKFMETYEITMSRAANRDIDTLEYGGLRLILTAKKNSFGPSRKRIQSELLWWYEPDDAGNWRQHTAWDWDTSTIDLLTSFELATGKKTIYNRIQEICDIKVVRKGGRLAYSKALGIGSKDEPVHYRILGAALEGRPDLLQQIYQVLGITPHRPFQPGIDYRDLIETAREAANTQAANLYQDVENLPQTAEADMGGETEIDPDPDNSLLEV